MTDYKNRFDIPSDITYLNAAFMGPMLKSSVEISQNCVAKKLKPWEITTSDFFGPIEKARALIAQLIDAPENNIAIIPSASYGIATASKNLSHLSSGEILVIEDQFPSNYYSWSELAKEKSHKLITIKRDFSKDMTKSVLEKINIKTRILAMPHVHWCDGQMFQLELISGALKSVNAKLVIDGTQSIGAVDFNLPRVKPDFLIAAAYKWLLGPYTMGFMYVDDQYLEKGVPLEHNWTNKYDAENFSDLVNYKDRYLSGARRFDMGGKSQFHTMSAFVDTLEFLNEVGVQKIAQHCSELNQHIVQSLQHSDQVYFWPSSQRAGNILGMYFKDQSQLDLVKQALIDEKIYVSYRGKAMRVSPHIYNSQKEIDNFLSVVTNSLKIH